MRATIVILAAAGLVLTGCARQSGGGGQAQEVPHGYVEGAEETAETQSRLVLVDEQAEKAHVLDLVTGKVSLLAEVGDVESVTGDGRFAYLTTATGDVRVIDSGAWTVDHGDHAHHYRSAPRDLGTLAGRAPTAVATSATVTAVRSSDGTVRLVDRSRMEKGELAETRTLKAAAAVPFGDRLLVAEGGQVRVDGAGSPVGACADAAGVAVTRRGAVFGCADGALLVTEKDGTFTGVRIPYPGERPRDERATEFHHRPGSTVLAAKAGKTGVWVLDVTARTWRLLKTGPTVAVSATGPGSPVLCLTEAGELRAYDPRSGKEAASTALLRTPLTGSPAIQVDTARAYVNDPAGRVVHEIDYNDRLRRARTFEPGFAPAHMTETGR
ncbi:ABC transporter [Nonomuraea purpurea]|uniref:ABC transporter n=1 Tax=Nonomuraea purpurea TaxID=1849276 RepID=A0ABV8GIH3_9ACTN